MPITHSILADRRVVVTRITGTIDNEEMLEAYRRLYSDPGWSPGFHEVADFRTANMREVTNDAVEQVGELSERMARGTPFKTAVIAPGDLPFGLARMYEALAAESPEEVRVFRDAARALAWLELEPELLEEQ